ncbi:MAG TPA: hypothetical protein VGD94_07665 [Vicinamibacterales bacterium]
MTTRQSTAPPDPRPVDPGIVAAIAAAVAAQYPGARVIRIEVEP